MTQQSTATRAQPRALLSVPDGIFLMVGMVLGVGEIIVLVFILVVVFSASRMGTLGNALGKFVYSFKKASHGEDFVDVRRTTERLSQRSGKSIPEDGEIVDGERKP